MERSKDRFSKTYVTTHCFHPKRFVANLSGLNYHLSVYQAIEFGYIGFEGGCHSNIHYLRNFRGRAGSLTCLALVAYVSMQATNSLAPIRVNTFHTLNET